MSDQKMPSYLDLVDYAYSTGRLLAEVLKRGSKNIDSLCLLVAIETIETKISSKVEILASYTSENKQVLRDVAKALIPDDSQIDLSDLPY